MLWCVHAESYMIVVNCAMHCMCCTIWVIGEEPEHVQACTRVCNCKIVSDLLVAYTVPHCLEPIRG